MEGVSRREANARPVRLFQLILRAYPREFRAAFGDEMTRFFAACWQQASESGGPEMVRLLIRTLLDFSQSVPRQHVAARRRRQRTRGEPMLQTLRQDLKYALRGLAAKPGFSLFVVTSLILGTVPVTVMLSVVNSILRPPRHVEAPERLRAAFVTGDSSLGSQFAGLTYPELRQLEALQAIEGAAGFQIERFNWSDEEQNQTKTLRGLACTVNYFDLLGIPAGLGRAFAEWDGRADSQKVALLGHAAWKFYFEQDPDVLGRSIRLNGQPHTVIGVAPEGLTSFREPSEADIYVPLPEQWKQTQSRRRLSSLVRLAADASEAQAASQLQALSIHLGETDPAVRESRSGRVRQLALMPLSALRVPVEHKTEIAAFLSLILFLCFLLLAAACANLAGLLLARGKSRSREIAVRLALGARRSRVVALLLAESVLLVAIAGAASLLAVHWLSQALAAGHLLGWVSEGVTTLDITLDWQVTLISLAVYLLTGLLFGLAPALRSSRTELAMALQGQRILPSGGRRFSLSSALVTVQVTASMVLLVCAGLFLGGLERAATIDLGFDPQRVAVAELDLSQGSYTESLGRVFVESLTNRLQGLPQVSAASFAVWAPFSGSSWSTGVRAEEIRSAGFINFVGPRYFELLGMPILAGRSFNDREPEDGPPPAIVNETLAQTLWPGRSLPEVLGRQFVEDVNSRPVRVVGVVRDARYTYLTEPAFLHFWIPFSSIASFAERNADLRLGYSHKLQLLARSSQDPSQLLGTFQQSVAELEPNLPMRQPRLLSDLVRERSTDDPLLGLQISAAGGLFALLLAAVGIYAVVNFSVARRTSEIGLRMALGARRSDVIRMVVRQGLRLVIIGVLLGIAGAVGAAQILSALFEGLMTLDVPSAASGIAVLLLAALAAALGPAWRASRLDPMQTLRCE